MGSLSTIDQAIVLLSLAATLVIGLWVSVYNRTGREFFLAGRTLPWWAVALSLAVTDLGGSHAMHFGGTVSQFGLSAANREWIGCVPAMIVAAFVIVPHLWRSGATTIPEFLERRFDGRVRTAIGACWVISLACQLAILFVLCGRMMQTLAHWPVTGTIIGLGMFVCVCAWLGGMAVVVYAGALRSLLLIAVCACGVIVGLLDAGGWSALRNEVLTHEAHLEKQQAANDPLALVEPLDASSPFPWTGILFGFALVMGPTYWMTDQTVMQRMLSARSDFEAKAAFSYAAVFRTLISASLAVLGLMAVAHYRSAANPERALPVLVNFVMPGALKGLFVAGFLGALMSGLEVRLNAAAALFTNDVYLRWMRPAADERRLLWIGRIITVALTVFAVWCALFFGSHASRVEVFLPMLMIVFHVPAFAVLLSGLFTRSANRYGALAGFLGGVLTAATLFFTNGSATQAPFAWQPSHGALVAFSVWTFLISGMVTAIVSYATQSDPAEKQQFALGLKEAV